jgi:hypothetical protein
MPEKISLPEGTSFGTFVPIAYYDKHMDCIRVLIQDRSVTEHRLNGFITLYEANHRGPLEPEHVGFVIKGVSHLFSQAGLPLDRVYKLAELIDGIVRYQPASTMAHILRLIYKDYHAEAGNLEVDFKEAA